MRAWFAASRAWMMKAVGKRATEPPTSPGPYARLVSAEASEKNEYGADELVKGLLPIATRHSIGIGPYLP